MMKLSTVRLIILAAGSVLFSLEGVCENAGTVVSVTGTALIRGEKSGTPAHALKVGDTVQEGDVINTPSNGQVKLLLADRTIMDIGNSALFHVRKFAANQGPDRQVDVSMMYGQVRAAVSQPIKGKGSFKVRTSTAVMGVRGTEFVVKADIPDLKQIQQIIANPEKPQPKPQGGSVAASKTEITVVQGKVDVEQSKPKSNGRTPAKEAEVVSLTAGKQLTTSSDQTPAKPVTLDTEQLKSVQASAKVDDNTFKKAIVIDMGSASSGISGSGGAGMANITGQIIAQTIAAPPANISMPISAVSAGFAGGFGGPNASPVVNVPVGGLHRLKVVLTR